MAASSTTSRTTAPDPNDIEEGEADHGATKKKRKSKKKRAKDRQQQIAEEKTPSDSQETKTSGTAGAAKTPTPIKVKTHFAHQLARVQRELYISLRSNISRFIDSTCNEIILNRIAQYEQTTLSRITTA